jgi:formylglycine-generating enzyme required for sulfatase activity
MGFPSELQWEYAIRAGTTTTWWTGNDEKGIVAKENIGGDNPRLLPVGSMSPNNFGLFDMGGNLVEWCADDYGAHGTEGAGDGRRPEPPGGSTQRCIVGGDFANHPDLAISGYPRGRSPLWRASILGLRAARTSRL